MQSYFDNAIAVSTHAFEIVKFFLNEIEVVYKELVNVLQSAASAAIPLKRGNVEKCWWDAELSNLKNVSITTHKAWVDAGRPRSGPIATGKIKAKSKYKNYIQKKKKKNWRSPWVRRTPDQKRSQVRLLQLGRTS